MCNQGVSKPARQILPTHVRPSHYNVTLVPGLESLKFTGQVSISLEVTKPTKTIVANANELIISSASVVAFRVEPGGLALVDSWQKSATNRATQPATSITYDNELQTVTFEFEHEIPAIANLILHAEFEGIHNDQMAGFYRSPYTDEFGKKRNLVVTQFQASDCRRAFPSWDEPNIKATFDITLNVPEDKVALSNMNIIEEKPIEINGKSFKTVKFARTPVMSTYLVAFCVGDLEYIESIAHPVGSDPITCRVYTLRGLKESGRFSLDVCTKTLEYFSEYFDVAYPLPKMDMIALPDFAAGAMENWGLVTYRESVILYDPATSSNEVKKDVAYTVGHELAHQWFGNLVTMDWWSELWLNEGFATFVGWLAVDHLFPDWKVFTSFVADELSYAFRLDGLRSSHPIEVDVSSPDEINQIFDGISYSKGGSVIRMLNNYLGGEIFANGIKMYLKKHAYSNATTLDLWKALSQSSGEDVASLMYNWTREMGFPLITVTKEDFNPENSTLTLHLTQTKFLSSGDITPEEESNAPIWVVPVTVVTNDSQNPTNHLLTGKTGTISFKYTQESDSFWKLNFEVNGLFRVAYSQDQLVKIANAIERSPEQFPVQDRINLLEEIFALAKAGYTNSNGALELLRSYKNETNQMVLEEVSTWISVLKRLYFEHPDVVDGLNGISRSIFSPKVAQVGYDYFEGEDFLVSKLRDLVITSAASAGDESVVSELKHRLRNYLAGDKKALHSNLRPIGFEVFLSKSTNPEEDFEAALNVVRNGQNTEEKLIALQSIGAINDLKLTQRILDSIVFDTELVKLQDITSPLRSIMLQCPNKADALRMLWSWYVKHWDLLHQKLSGSLGLLGGCTSISIRGNISEEFADQAEAWKNGEDCVSDESKMNRSKQLKSVEREFNQSIESLRINASWFKRDFALVQQWVLKQTD